MSVQERAAEVLEAHGCSAISWVDGDAICATCDRIVGHVDDDLLDEIAFEAAHQAQMLADAGLLAESAPVAGGNGAVSGEQSHPRPTTPVTVDSLTARLVAARAATDGYRTEAERLRELLDEAHAKIERMEAL